MKLRNKRGVLCALLAGIFTLTGCGNTDSDPTTATTESNPDHRQQDNSLPDIEDNQHKTDIDPVPVEPELTLANAEPLTLAQDESLQLLALNHGEPVDGNPDWNTLNPKVATVSETGIIQGAGEGTTFVYFSFNQSNSPLYKIEVAAVEDDKTLALPQLLISDMTPVVTIDQAFAVTLSLHWENGASKTLDFNEINWTVDNPDVVSIQTDTLQAASIGTTSISASPASYPQLTYRFTTEVINDDAKPEPEPVLTSIALYIGESDNYQYPMTLTAHYSDSSQKTLPTSFCQVEGNTANVSPTDLVVLAEGVHTITCSYEAFTVQAVLNVDFPSLHASPLPEKGLLQNTTHQLIVYLDETPLDFSVMSVDVLTPALICIDKYGLITALSAGEAKFNLSYEGKTLSLSLAINQPQPREIVVTTSVIPLTVGETSPVSFAVRYTDNSLRDDLSEEDFSIESSNTEVIIINDEGLIESVGAGEAYVTISSLAHPEIAAAIAVNVSALERFSMPLGAIYSPGSTTFSIWSPDTGNVKVSVDGQVHHLQSLPDSDGLTNIYSVTLNGDWYLKPYHFLINDHQARDPYATMTIPGTNDAIVMDFSRTGPAGGWVSPPELEDLEDAIIYEMHIKDFTWDQSSGVLPEHRGKYLGMVERGTTYTSGEQTVKTGLDHLVELGVTHVHILPFYDFKSCQGEDDSCYNWGYDPYNYNVPEERYAQAPYDYVQRVNEVKTMINELHKAGIRVIMDVVYNHVPGEGNESPLGDVTGQYFLPTDLSGVGRSLDSANLMVRRYIRDSLEFWAREYRVDGFRFDLMGIFGTDAIEEWSTHLQTVAPGRNLLIYGEPWQVAHPEIKVPYAFRQGNIATIANARVSAFNDQFRNALKATNDDPWSGFGMGESGGDYQLWNGLNLPGYVRNTLFGLRGAIREDDSTAPLAVDFDSRFASDPEQTINYVTAHDNLCLRDKIELWADVYGDSSDTFTQKKIGNFLNGIVLTAQGIPFIHSGAELWRTKDGHHNTYNASNELNKIDWHWKIQHYDVFIAYQKMIAIRKANEGFRINNREDIAKGLGASYPADGVLITEIDVPPDLSGWRRIQVIYNSTPYDKTVELKEKWQLGFQGADTLTPEGQTVSTKITVGSRSMTILYQTP